MMMNTDMSWWKDNHLADRPRVRWFGFLRRSVKLSENIPQRLSVPSIILSVPRHVSPSDDNSLSSPISLMISFPLSIPGNLISGQTQLDDCVCGSVGLAGILLKEEPSGLKPSKRAKPGLLPQTSEDSLHKDEQEISLTKRLLE